MARTRRIIVKPALGGVVRVSGFQSTEPYTAASATNMWPVDVKTSRRRIATRPRFVSYDDDITDVTDPKCRGLAQVNVVNLASPNQPLQRALFAIGDTDLWRLTAAGDLTSIAANFATDRHIQMQGFLDKLFIADLAEMDYYDCTTNTLVTAPTYDGTSPASVRLITEWGGRLVVSGQLATPHAVYMSRIGDPLDWDYAETGVGAAVNMTTFTDGLIGEQVTALISHNRECLIIGATDSMHILRGNPLDGGRMEILSHTVGPLSGTSWCKANDDTTLIMTRNGLYMMPPGCGAAPTPFSNKRIPDSLLGIDTSTTEVFMAFDTRFNGVHIYLTQSGSNEAWWLDWETGGFWPMELSSSEKPYAILRFDPLDGNNVSGVLLGGADGNLRRFDRTDTGAITTVNYITNPIKLSASPTEKGIIQRMQCVFSSNTTDTTGTVAVYCAESGEAAYAAAVADTASRKFSITLANQSNNLISYPRVGGHAAVIKFTQGSTTTHTGLEEITLDVMEAGVMR